jgi:hypothetical protein
VKKITVSIAPDALERLDASAARLGVSRSEAVGYALTVWAAHGATAPFVPKILVGRIRRDPVVEAREHGEVTPRFGGKVKP